MRLRRPTRAPDMQKEALRPPKAGPKSAPTRRPVDSPQLTEPERAAALEAARRARPSSP